MGPQAIKEAGVEHAAKDGGIRMNMLAKAEFCGQLFAVQLFCYARARNQIAAIRVFSHARCSDAWRLPETARGEQRRDAGKRSAARKLSLAGVCARGGQAAIAGSRCKNLECGAADRLDCGALPVQHWSANAGSLLG